MVHSAPAHLLDPSAEVLACEWAHPSCSEVFSDPEVGSELSSARSALVLLLIAHLFALGLPGVVSPSLRRSYRTQVDRQPDLKMSLEGIWSCLISALGFLS